MLNWHVGPSKVIIEMFSNLAIHLCHEPNGLKTGREHSGFLHTQVSRASINMAADGNLGRRRRTAEARGACAAGHRASAWELLCGGVLHLLLVADLNSQV